MNKRDLYTIYLDDVIPIWHINPYPHPRVTEQPKKLHIPGQGKRQVQKMLALRQKVPVVRLREIARAYFGWELMNGGKIELMRKDPYWKYMEDDDAT